MNIFNSRRFTYRSLSSETKLNEVRTVLFFSPRRNNTNEDLGDKMSSVLAVARPFITVNDETILMKILVTKPVEVFYLDRSRRSVRTNIIS